MSILSPNKWICKGCGNVLRFRVRTGKVNGCTCIKKPERIKMSGYIKLEIPGDETIWRNKHFLC